MAKTPLFHRLGRIASRSLFVEPPEPAAVAAARVSRRGLLFASLVGVAGCGREPNPTLDPEQPAPHRIAVIGAGLAGLHCAYRLFKAGADVTVYDGNARTGGRVFTARGLFRDHAKLAYELGAEFIEGHHRAVLALLEEFALDRVASGAAGRDDVLWLGGHEVSDDVIAEQFERVAPAIRAALRGANDDPVAFRTLDNTTLADFLDLNVPSLAFPELSALLRVAFRSEFGLEPDEQSALNLMFLVGSPDLASFRVGSASDGRVRVRDGTAKLTEALEGAIGSKSEPRVKLDQRLTRIASLGSPTDPLYELSFVSTTGVPSVAEAERVVFAIPFSVLDRVDLNGLGLSSAKRRVIHELGYGKGSKLVGAFASRVWRDANKSGVVFSDLGFQELWDSSTAQAEPLGTLTSLIGGNVATRAELTPAAESMATLLGEVEPVFKNLRTVYLQNTAVRMHWPSAPLFRGSNACLTPGQWAHRGVLGRREGNLHFCGEHCSLDFPGRMEGAAETSALVAAEILEELGLALPTQLGAILRIKDSVPHPAYRNGDAQELGILDRLALVARAHALAGSSPDEP